MQYTSLPDGFTIQELDASHLEQFNALLRYAFQVTEEELVQVGWQEDEIKQSKFPILESAHVLGCFEGKTLAAQIAVYPMQVNVEGALLDTGFVTGVATYPEYAGIGLMSTLIRQALTDMRGRGQSISFLCPYSIPFYRKQGWEIVADKMTFSIRDTQLPKHHAVPGQIERVPVEHEDIRRVYKYFALQQHGALIRGDLEWEEYWRWESDDIMAAVYYTAEEKPLGYVIYYIENEVFQIKEMIWLTQEAKYGIWNYISAHFSMITKVEGANYTGESIAFQFEDSEIDETIKPNVMARIVDVQRFFEEYSFQFEDEKLKLYFRISDPAAEWNNGIFHVTWKDGKTFCEKVDSHGAAPLIEMDIQTLTTMLMGYKRPTYLYNNDRIRMDYYLLPTLESLIPPEKPYFSDYF